MIERDINIEFESDKIAIEAKIFFTMEEHVHYDDWCYRPEHTEIKRVVNLELNEGAPPIPATMKHFKMLEKYWGDNDVYEEI